MLNWWLIVVAIVMAIVVLGLVFYLVFLYSSEDDKNQAWVPKVIVIFGLSLACFNVLLLPYDVANKINTSVADDTGGGINTVLVWQIVLYSVAVMTFLIVPFAMFYYEAQDPEKPSILRQLRPAVAYTAIMFVIFVIFLVTLWLVIGKAKIPYTLYTSVDQPQFIAPSNPGLRYTATLQDTDLDIRVSIFVYMAGLMSAVGWVLFFVFGGIGLAALPMDLIVNFKDRPKPITAAEYVARKEIIGRETQTLMKEGQEIEEAERTGAASGLLAGRRHKKRMLLFRNKVAALEEAFEKLDMAYDKQGGSVIQAWLGLVVGVVGALLSIGWILQIIIHNIFNIHPLISDLFVALDGAFTLFGTVGYGIFAFYLLWCVVKGCTKFGLNFVVFQVHPMKLGATLMNSFLFNTLLILITSVSVVQFCAASFSSYVADTAVNALYGTYVTRLVGINYVNKYLQYPMPLVAVATFLWLIICPRCKSDDDDE